MKRNPVALFFVVCGVLLMAACTTVNLTSWKDPAANEQISHVVILGMFDKLEVMKPMEENVASYFTAHGLTCTKSLDFMAPGQPFSADELKTKVSGLGADAVLVFTPKSADKSVNYTPPTYSGFYGGWRGGFYASPGYYSESTTYHIQANLYVSKDEKLIWTGDISTTDPSSVDVAASEIAQSIYKDWVKNGIVTQVSK